MKNYRVRIIHLIPSLAQGGAESQLERLINHSRNSDFEHIVISLKSEETPLMSRLKENNIPVYCMGFDGLGVFPGLLKVKKLLRTLVSPVTVIQCWMYHANLLGLLVAILLGFSDQVVWNIRRTELPKGMTGVLSKIAAKLTYFISVKIVCCAEAAQKSHVEAGYNADNMLVIQNGIDVELFQQSKKNNQLFRQELGLSDNDFVIGMVGRYAPIKGHLYLLQAFKHLVTIKKFDMPPIKLVLIGRGIESAEELQPFLTDSLLTEYLIIIPERADIYNVMPSLNLLCLPSKSEGFPNVVAEAMASGVPAIVTDVGDAALIVGNKNMIIPLDNVELTAERLLNFSLLSTAEKIDISDRVRERVVENFSIEKAWQNYSALYKQIIEKKY